MLAKGAGRVPNHTDNRESGNTIASIQTIQPPATMEPSFDLLLPTPLFPAKIDIFSVVSRPELDMLYHQYFRAVHPLAHVLHKPTFDRQFYGSCLSNNSASKPTKSFTALVLAVCFAAAVSLSQTQPQVQFQSNRVALVDRLKLASERALVAAQHLKSLKLETMQAFAIYLVTTMLSPYLMKLLTMNLGPPSVRTNLQSSNVPCGSLSPASTMCWSPSRCIAFRHKPPGVPHPQLALVSSLLPRPPYLRNTGSPAHDPRRRLRHALTNRCGRPRIRSIDFTNPLQRVHRRDSNTDEV